MTDLKDRLSKLSPEQRELLLKKLQQQKGQKPKKETIAKRDNPDFRPLTASQHSLWFLYQLQPDSPFYNIPLAVRIEGPLNIKKLKESVRMILERHEILRAHFPTTDKGQPEQKIHDAPELQLKKTDLSEFNGNEQENELHRLLKADAAVVFKIERYPLYHLHLIRLKDNLHVFSLVLHHIIADGWSLGIFIKDFSFIYKALTENQDNPLPPPELQFADYAVWRQKQASDEKQQKQLDFWKSYLRGMPPVLELIADKPRPSIQTYNGRHYRFTIGETLTKKLRALSKQNKVSLYNMLMAAFQVFLHKVTGQDDFGVGAPIANRNRRETEDIIGYFVNTVVLRADFSKSLTFGELIRRVQQNIAEASDNQDVPFEKIVEALAPDHELSHSPLFQVMFDLQQSPFEELNIDSVKITQEDIEVEVAKFDLLMLMLEKESVIEATLEYNSDLFEAATIERLAHYFVNLLNNITKNPAAEISNLSLMTADEKNDILHRWNDTKRPYPKNKAVNVIFEETAKKYTDLVVMAFAETTLTFDQLNRRANQFARVLSEKGISAGDPAALYMERTPDMFVTILAILKAGGYYVPLDTAYPRERMLFMLEDCGAKLLISEEALLTKIDSDQSEMLTIETLRSASAAKADGNLPPKNDGNSPAYIIYTSGSTGKPKGVTVPHRAISRLVINTNYIQLGPGERIAQISNATFDAATLEIWGTFLTGATLVGFEKDLVLSIQSFAREINEKKITAMFLTSALFNQIVLDIPDAFKNMNYLLTGGDAADVQSFRKVLNSAPPKHLINGYGPTENTTFSACYEAKELSEDELTIPIGKPIANSYHYIVDKYHQPVPVGIPGELLLGGDGLAFGYHNRPGLSEERFMSDPFDSDPDSRLYRSGDLVRYRPDGNVEFLGRIDQQVKIRGFRVELGEIETILKENLAVKDCAVIAREDLPGAKQLAAYIVSVNDQFNPGALKQYLKGKLPDYMIPPVMVQLEKLPITPNGKLDRRALPKPDQQRSTTEDYVAPRNPLEEYLAESWQEILKIDKIGIHDNFFELGGNSLQAAVFNNKLQKDFNVEAHVAGVFKAPRIAEFAAYVFEYYPEEVKKNFGDAISSDYGVKLRVADAEIKKLKKQDFDHFKTIIKPLPDFKQDGKKNPRAVFALSPPRSGSTLLRIMLAGNKKLFSPPELDLLSFNTLGERYDEFSQDGLEIWLESPIRALMEIFDLDFDSAKAMMREKEQTDWPVKSFYRLLQSNIGGRLLVDKTPTYPFDKKVLERAETDFEEPLYIHLLRHPYAMIYSFIEAKLDQNFFRHKHPYTRRELAELIWQLSHRNILDFSARVPADRYFQVKFEDILRDPEAQLSALCRFLQIDFDEEMLKPYQGQKMTDAARKNSQMVGDFKFYLHRNINTKVIDRWREHHKEDFLSDTSWELAEKLGYEVEKEATKTHSAALSKIQKIPRTERLPLSFAQQRLWFLEQMDPGNPQYNIPVAVHMKGRLAEEPFTKTLLTIFNRHESLRTHFYTKDGKAYQQIYPDPRSENIVDYMQGTPADDPKIKQIISEESKKPFNIETGPLVRFRYIVLNDDELIMIMVIHHIIADGWSLGIFFREFAALYNHHLNQSELKLPELEIQYADYAAWQREWLQARVMQRQLSYWHEKLAGAPARLDLPTDHPRPPVKTYNGKRITFRFDREASDKIKAFARSCNCTLFSVMLTVYQILLARYSGQDDILVGTPNAYRNREEVEHLIGFFVNTLVIRTLINSDHVFDDLLKQVQNNLIEAFENQDIPFEKLVDELEPERNMSHTPLFQVMFSLQPDSVNLIEVPGLSMKPIPTDTETAKFDINLTLLERFDRIIGEWEYNTDLFDEATIERYIRHYMRLTENLIAARDKPVTSISLLDSEEENEIIGQLDRGAIPVAEDTVIPRLFEAQTAQAPNHIAVVDPDTQLSYGELNRRANQLARYLIEQGVGRDDMIGLVANRSVASVIGLMAIWKAGAAYLPIDPFYPKERIDYILDDAHAKFIVNPDSSDLDLGEAACPVLHLDQMETALAAQASENPSISIDAGHIAYVIYTSGSTGRPKGVMLEHGNALHLLANMNKQVYASLPDNKYRLSLNAPFAFDASVEQIIMLAEGHTLVFIPQDFRNDGEMLKTYIEEQHIDVLDCVPSQLKLLVEAGLLTSTVWKPRVIMPGGEAIDQALWQTMCEHRDIQFFNLYGPTECAVNATILKISDPFEEPLIGRPAHNLRFYILDRNMNVVPEGVPGELLISGKGVARGYVDRPDLTAEKFLPDPFANKKGERMYRSGDLVSMQPGGNLKFHGRIDDQVKVRGFRIELGEIENTLKKHPAIADAVVIVREDKPGLKQISAYYTIKEKAEADPGDLRAHLQQQLPDYMIPVFYIPLDEIPLLPNGKTDRKKLPAPDSATIALSSEFKQASSEKETILAEIWSELLNLQTVGVHDNFFELGGDSIISIQVIARARQMGLHLTPKDLFENPTIEKLARAAKKSTAVKAEQGMIEGGFELLPVQHNFFERQLKNPHHFNQALMLEVRESLDPHLLEQTLRKIMEHHDALRLRFGGDKDKQQPVFENTIKSLPFDYHDLSKSDGNNLDDRINDAGNQAQQSLDIEKGPMLRMTYFHLPEGRGDRLHIVCHHLVIDGVSWRILLEDIQSVYRRLEKKQTLRLPLKTSSVKDWSQALQQYAKSEAMQPEIKYWQALTAKPFTALPEDNVQGGNSEAVSNIITVTLEKELTEALLRDVPPVYNTQINEILLTALLQSFKRRTGQDQLWILMEGHGRESVSEDVDLSRTVGWFTSLYPLFLSLGGVSELGEAIKSVKEQVRALPQNGIGYGVLRYLSDEKVQDAMRQLPDPQISFNYLGQFDQGGMQESAFAVRPAEEAGAERSPENDRTQLLDFSAGIHQGQFTLNILYSGEKFEKETMTALAENYLTELKSIIDLCKQSEQVEYTPSDFEDVELDQDDLADMLSELDEE